MLRLLVTLTGALCSAALSPGCAGPAALSAESASQIVITVNHATKCNELVRRQAEDRFFGFGYAEFVRADSAFHAWEGRYEELIQRCRNLSVEVGLQDWVKNMDNRMDSVRSSHTFLHPLFGER